MTALAVLLSLFLQPIASGHAQLPAATQSAAIAARPTSATTTGATPPNILVIVLDDIGAEKLRPYQMGAPYARTPVLNTLAQQGVTFTNFYVNPLCGPTRAALQTGRYAFRTGFGPNIFPAYQFGLNLAEPCLPRMLHDGFAPQPSPYVTGAFGKWHLSTYSDLAHPNQCGYDHFSGCISNVADENDIYNTSYHHFYWRKDVDGTETVFGSPTGPFDETTWSASVTMRDSSDWMLAQTRPFFADVCFNAPHAPYQVPPWSLISASTRATVEQLGIAQVGHPYVQGDYAQISDLVDPVHPLSPTQYAAKKQAFYDAMIEAVDTNLGQLFARLAPKLADTWVIVFSDNGTDPGVIDTTRYNPNHAKRTCYQLGVRTPMFVIGPGVDAPGRFCSAPVSVVDIWRTVRDIAGASEAPSLLGPGMVLDSKSFFPLLASANATYPRRYAFAEVFNPIGNPVNFSVGSRQRMLTDGHWKIVRTGLDDLEELFDIDADPLETQNLLPYTTNAQKTHYEQLKQQLDLLIHSDG